MRDQFVSECRLRELFKHDESLFRHLLDEMIAEKVAELKYDDRKRAALEIAKAMDDALVVLDTEATMFSSSYICVSGFEDFTISKVMQIIESATDVALGDGPNAPEVQGETSWWSEDEREQLLVAFHSIVLKHIGEKLSDHWEAEYLNDDIAFRHACWALNESISAPRDIIRELPELRHDAFLQPLELVRLLDQRDASVFTLMRIMEVVISTTIDSVQRSCTNAEVTADLCIPLIVYIIVVSQPLRFQSRLRFIMDFTIPVLEMSSLGYALTTFEAASAQILDEYRSLVVSR
jgi:hypothetical protein